MMTITYGERNHDMRIVSWNCNTAFCGKDNKKINRKFQVLMKEYPADIYVIQECENSKVLGTTEYKELLSNGFWIGKETEKAQEKGMAVFSPNKEIKLEKEEWAGLDLYKFFLPVRVNDKFTL